MGAEGVGLCLQMLLPRGKASCSGDRGNWGKVAVHVIYDGRVPRLADQKTHLA